VRTVSAVVLVKDGERRLRDLIRAALEQGVDELLVIDSGSRDRSRELAETAGARVIAIPQEQFGHGRTRNLGAAWSTGELICFLTQDAVPAPGWLESHREAFELDERVGASYGPHLPWPDTSPMIARELTEFFATMSPDGRPALHGPGDLAFLSNVNACYRRSCWEEIRFDEVAYAEDQAFGKSVLERGWLKVFHPGAAVYHAHDYGPLEFGRRYFDEYRGLRETTGHVEPAAPKAALRALRHGVARDRGWMRERGWSLRRRASWTARSAFHYPTRHAAAVLGSRAHAVPPALQRRLSLEGRANSHAAADDGASRLVEPSLSAPHYEHVLRVSREGPAPLAEPVAGMAGARRLHLAWAIPPFQRGSGGHTLIFALISRLEAMGHTCTVWVHDPRGRHRDAGPGVLRRRIAEWFEPIRAPVFVGFDGWHGADVVVATGWQTAHPVASLAGCRARAYLVSDHEPEFYATSAHRLWAEQTYELGLYAIAGSGWLRDLVARRYGGEGSSYGFGVDLAVYRPRDVERRPDTVIFYARHSTPRRAVPLGMLALEELCRRRPDTRVLMFGQTEPLPTTFGYDFLGIAPPAELARRYCEATVGLCLSLTHYSLIPQEMMACGLPCVDVAGGSGEAVFGASGAVELAAADPVALADAIEALLGNPDRWLHRSQAGLEFVAGASWEDATIQVEEALRSALRLREPLSA